MSEKFISYEIGPRQGQSPNLSTVRPFRLSRDTTSLGIRNSKDAFPSEISENWKHEENSDSNSFEEFDGDGYLIVRQEHIPREDSKAYWYTNNGIIIVETSNGMNFRGSGCLIAPNLVLTAGHVVFSHENGGNASSISFIVNYPHDQQKFRAKRIYVMPQWAKKQLYQYDLALIYLDRPISSSGYHGVIINWPFETSPNYFGWSSVSYPATLPECDNCLEMVLDGGPKSRRAFTDNGTYFRDGIVAWEKSNLTPGSSGGGWMSSDNHPRNTHGSILLSGIRGSRGRTPLIGSVTSYIRLDKPGIVYGPDFKTAHGDFIMASLYDTLVRP